MENIQDFFNEKMKSFFCAVHSFGKPIIYGVVSCQGVTNLVIGIYGEQDRAESVKSVIEGLMDGIELCLYKPFFSKRSNTGKNVGFISAVPSVRISDDKQKFDISSLMKSLNGQDYTMFFIARPISQQKISKLSDEVIRIRDACFAVSKRNISRQNGTTHTQGETQGEAATDTHTEGYTFPFFNSKSGTDPNGILHIIPNSSEVKAVHREEDSSSPFIILGRMMELSFASSFVN